MKINAKLTYKNDTAKDIVNVIAGVLAPDNVPGIKTIVKDDSVTVLFNGDKIGTILSSFDDYLMNAKIAYEIVH